MAYVDICVTCGDPRTKSITTPITIVDKSTNVSIVVAMCPPCIRKYNKKYIGGSNSGIH